MGQSIDVLLYGCRCPDGLDVRKFVERWEKIVAPKVIAYEARIRERTNYSWGFARQGFVPVKPCPDDAAPDALVGFYVCRGYHDNGEAHRLPAMTFPEMRRTEPTATILKRCRRRWSRFARWARGHGVEFGKPRIWRTRTEVA